MGESNPTTSRFLHTVTVIVACVFCCAAHAQADPEWADYVGQTIEVRYNVQGVRWAESVGRIESDGTMLVTAGDATVGVVLNDVTANGNTHVTWTMTIATDATNEATDVVVWNGEGFMGDFVRGTDHVLIGEPGFEVPGTEDSKTNALVMGLWFLAGIACCKIMITSYRRRSWTF